MKNKAVIDFDEIDRIIHEPARLKIMICLSMMYKIDFNGLLYHTILSRGNLSVQLQRLEAAGYIEIEKTFEKRVPRTIAIITDAGTKALRIYKDNLRSILDSEKPE
ncbi:MAG: transcriptional regulator [Candidatus Cloacimonetes bacterium]|nr:transcriptional regulator [Candidatus Cloacimonadota bacterium]